MTKSKKPANPANPLQPKPKELMVPFQPNESFIEEISDLLANLPLNTSVELTCRILTSVPILSFAAVHSWAVLKTVILFVAEYGSMALEDMDFAVELLECWRWPWQDAGTGSPPYAMWDRHLPLDQDPPQVRRYLLDSKLCCSPYWLVNWRKWNSYTGLPRYRSLRCTCPRSKAPGGYCRPGHAGR